MPPVPTGEEISYGPSRVPGVRGKVEFYEESFVGRMRRSAIAILALSPPAGGNGPAPLFFGAG